VSEINQALRELFWISSRLHCDVLARWVPRDSLAEADALLREADASDWKIDPVLYGKITRKFDTFPSVDLFASDTSHVAAEFVSKNIQLRLHRRGRISSQLGASLARAYGMDIFPGQGG
jgi:hypothetical protein